MIGNHDFIIKTNKDVDEWMDEFYVDGHKADFRLHCQWAWQEQERRHNVIEEELIEAIQKLLRVVENPDLAEGLALGSARAKAVAAISKAKGSDK